MTTNKSGKLIQLERTPVYRKLVRGLWIVMGLALCSFAALIIIASLGKIPSFEILENPKNNFTSVVYNGDGSVLGGYYIENRVPVDFLEISPNVIDALLATEDERYYSHSGIDFKGLARVGFKTVLLQQQSAGGGSTITQQLAKLLFTGKRASNIFERGIQKLREWVTAVKLERTYTKEEIISMYLNQFDFLNGAKSIKTAAETYFNASQDSLNIQQAAMLVGMLKNPSLYNPVRFPEKVKKRREVVLKQMLKNEMLTREAYDSIRVLPLGLSFSRKTHTDGLAPYFRMVLRERLKEILENEAEKKSDGSIYDIYRDGLKIYTTIDPKIQEHAEEAMWEHMQELQKSFNRHWRKLDPWTYEDDETTDYQLEIRQRTLKRLIRETDLYQNEREKYLGDILNQFNSEFPTIRLRDTDLEKMTDENEGFAALISENKISSEQASNYRKIMRSKNWATLEKQWNTFQTDIQKAFNTPAEMKVFAYNAQKEVDTTMTPLEAIKYHRMFLQTGIMAVDPVTGHIKAWVGGINHKYFKYDHVTSIRQVGSTFKPFVYSTAIQNQGFSPCYEVLDGQHTIRVGEGQFILSEDWSPQNFGKFTNREMTLFEGLKKSKNSISVYLMKELNSANPVVDLVDRMGIDTESRYLNGQRRILPVPSIALGAVDLTVEEMTGAYTTFANNGIYNKPTFISRIEDRNGRNIYQEEMLEEKALDANTNYVMVEMLKYAARGKRNFYKMKSEVGGKTGTTNDHVDGWFMGVTPNLVVGTWVGGEDQWIRFRINSLGQGSYMAAPFFVKLMVRLEADEELDWDTDAKFFVPPGELGIELDCDQYDIPSDEEFLDENDDFFEDPFGDEINEETVPRKDSIGI